MPNTKRSWIIFLVGAGLTLIIAGVSPLLIAYAQEATGEPVEVTAEPADAAEQVEAAVEAAGTAETAVEGEATPEPIYDIRPMPEVTGDNSYCMICHNQPWDTVTLGDGTIQNLYVVPGTIAASVHGANSSEGTFGCIDCHGENAFPHNNPSPSDERAYTLYSVSICASCHIEEVRELDIGLHEEAIRAGNREAAVCTDCHGAHDVQPIVEQPNLIAGVCGDCHENTLAEWQSSAHVDIEPLGCATCHSQHSQRLRAGNTPDELCINCHSNVDDVFVHDQHLNSESTVSVTCVDCHMYTGEPRGEDLTGAAPVRVSIDADSTGHSMLMDTTPCNTCHEQLVTSGEWDDLLAARGIVVIEPEMVSAPEAAEIIPAAEQSAESGNIPLIQGLLLGLGFGVTFAAVFIGRGMRDRAVTAPVAEPLAEPEAPVSQPAAEADDAPADDQQNSDGEEEV